MLSVVLNPTEYVGLLVYLSRTIVCSATRMKWSLAKIIPEPTVIAEPNPVELAVIVFAVTSVLATSCKISLFANSVYPFVLEATYFTNRVL